MSVGASLSLRIKDLDADLAAELQAARAKVQSLEREAVHRLNANPQYAGIAARLTGDQSLVAAVNNDRLLVAICRKEQADARVL